MLAHTPSSASVCSVSFSHQDYEVPTASSHARAASADSWRGIASRTRARASACVPFCHFVTWCQGANEARAVPGNGPLCAKTSWSTGSSLKVTPSR